MPAFLQRCRPDRVNADKNGEGGTAILNKIADRIESRLPTLALVEAIDNGKPIRETTHADLPLANA